VAAQRELGRSAVAISRLPHHRARAFVITQANEFRVSQMIGTRQGEIAHEKSQNGPFRPSCACALNFDFFQTERAQRRR
jgi:hypothetical protein